MRGEASRSVIERFPLAACRKRWLNLVDLEHETLLPATDFAREGDELLVWRAAIGARPLGARGAHPEQRAALFLQAAAAVAFFAAQGFALTPEDLEAAGWDLVDGSARLWLRRTPESVRRLEGAPDQPSAAWTLASLLRRLFVRGSRISQPGARTLLEQLCAPEAPWKRAEFWVSSTLRAFPGLAASEAASARERCLGLRGDSLRTPGARALAQKARAFLVDLEPRIFQSRASPLTPGGVLDPDASVSDVAAASRLLREQAEQGDLRLRQVWIAVAPERWDPLSRQAFEAAGLALKGRVDLVRIPESAAMPESPAEWRQALWMPCGTVAASIRFYETFAERAASQPNEPKELARSILRGSAWVRFASDPTGDAPWPEGSSAPIRTSAAPAGDPAEEPPASADPGSRIERLLESGQTPQAIEEAHRFVRAFPDRKVAAWFPLTARISEHLNGTFVPWLEVIEAEREIAGGRPKDGQARLERVRRHSGVGVEEKRAASLRLAEVAVALGAPGEGARRAAAWRREHRGAPAGQTVRALRLGAWGLAREGRFDCALALLEEAEDVGGKLQPAERIETALARARVLALSGRFEEEETVYESVRALALNSGDDLLAARFLAQEARRLLDRREPARAILRFQEALAVNRDDPGERAELLLDLAATMYHADDSSGSEAMLTECLAAASAAGREDLARIARGNRVELWINRCAWDCAAAEIASLEQNARAERDDLRLLVALHHRGRLALRRGLLAAAAADNARSRELAEKLSDRLEIGELWLEEGDRRLYEGDVQGARSAWQTAAQDPPDRCRSGGIASGRLEELSWLERGGPPNGALGDLDALFATDPYRAAETAARWRCLLGEKALDAERLSRAEQVLRAQGGEALADHVFGRGSGLVPSEALRGLRQAVSCALNGEHPDGHRSLEALGIAGLAVRDSEGREIACLGSAAEPGHAPRWKELQSGSARFELALWPDASPQAADSVAMLLETLLFRVSPAPPSSDFAEGWRRLGIATADASMEEPYRRLTRFAAQSVTVLIVGASGSGKEAVARAVHRLSPRASGPFVAVNVPAIPAALLESELFGHARGAFTGADRDRRGLLEEAAGGTIFFDEIGDLAAALQSKLLRTLQEREIRRVGENRARPIDARVVSATSRDLAERVEAGQFREDLFYRLQVAVIRLPPLKDRGRDALVLARHFLDQFAREYGRGRLRLTPEATAAIASYPWPGNVRELQNAISQAAALCDSDGAVDLALLPDRVRLCRGQDEEAPGDYRSRVDAHRRDLIADALDRAGGNRSRAARSLGLSRQALHYLIRELRVGLGRRGPGGA